MELETDPSPPRRTCEVQHTPGPLDWLIVGGGPHGVHAALRLMVDLGVDAERIAIVDPAPALLARWRARTGALAMGYLRSPAVHNLGPHPLSLQRFAGRRRDRDLGLFAEPYERPATALFDAHCDALLEGHGLDRLHRRTAVTGLRPRADHVRVDTADGRTLEAGRVLLALGSGAPAPRPAWAEELAERVAAPLEPGFAWRTPGPDDVVAVVGTGMTAAHAALRLVAEGARVELVARRAPPEHWFDTDPGWLGPKYMARFERLADARARRRRIEAARRRGSITPDLARALGGAVRAGRLRRRVDAVAAALPCDDGVELRLAGGARLAARSVLLCTGFAPGPPAPALVERLAREAALPLAPCGFPLVDDALRWHPRVHTSGALAELTLGPTARNLAGARRALDRVVDALGAERGTGRRELAASG